MRTLSLDLGERSYAILIGPGLLARPELMSPFLGSRRAVVVTNEVVGPLHLATLTGALERAGVRLGTIVLPDGEVHKNWQTLNRIYDELQQQRCERSTTLIALGGGVIGDLVGFAAATYLRGVPFIQVPTTSRPGGFFLLSVVQTVDGRLKLLVAEGEAVPGPILEIGNTNSRYRFPTGARQFVESWNVHGPAHHCAVGVGHIGGKVEKLGRLLQMEVVKVGMARRDLPLSPPKQ